MKIFITGHKGFFGSKLTKYIDVAYPHIQWQGYDLLENRNDLCDKYNLDLHIRKYNPDVVIHLAAKAGVTESKMYPQHYIDSNITGTQNLIDVCEKNKINKLIFFSSSSVFGKRKDEVPVQEEFEKDPVSLYGITKLAGEQIVKHSKIHEKFIVRPFTIYGSEGRPDGVIYKWINQIKKERKITIYGDENSYRGYVYAEHLIELVLQLAFPNVVLKPFFAKGECMDLNVGGSEKVYLKDIVDVFDEFVPGLEKEYIERSQEDIVGQVANTDKVKSLLDFDPPKKFKENLRKILEKELGFLQC